MAQAVCESSVERYLVSQIKTIGGKAYKWLSPGNIGVPDRLCFMPGGEVLLVEVKAPTGGLRPSQAVVHSVLAQRGHTTYIVKTKEAVDNLLQEYAAGTLRLSRTV